MVHSYKKAFMQPPVEHVKRRRKEALYFSIAVTVVLLPALALMYAQAFGPVTKTIEPSAEFLVTPLDSTTDIARNLKEAGLIKNEWAFPLALSASGGRMNVRPGGYDLSADMNLWQITDALTDSPYLVWVDVPSGLRKEEIGERLAAALSWNEDAMRSWLSAAEAYSFGLKDGVYFPDIYLIPSDQPPSLIAERMRDRFQNQFAPYAKEAQQKGIAWNDVLTIASLIEREAAGPHDMELIAGIIWNRIEEGMPLGIDATLQYIRGAEGNWWPVPQSEDKYLESPYNTYFTSGLPPGPINNPGLLTIRAVLNPEDTNCLYYLHDPRGRIHCATTYRAHVANVDRYLR